MKNSRLFKTLGLLFFLIVCSATLPMHAEDLSGIEFQTQIGGWPNHAATQGNYTYLIQGNHITVLDISGSSIEKKNTLSLDSEPFYLFLFSGYLLVFNTSSDSGLQMIDISDPESPVNIGKFAIPTERPVQFRQNGALFYIVSGNYFHILKFDELYAPSITQTIPIEDGNCIDVSGNTIYIGTENSMLIFEDIENPELKTTLPSLAVQALAVNSGYLYMGVENGPDKALNTYDLADPLNPVLSSSIIPKHTVGSSTWIKNPRHIIIDNQILYLACTGGDPSLICYHLTNPQTPGEIGYYEFNDAEYANVQSFTIQGSTAYMCLSNAVALLKIDISDPTNPDLMNTYTDINDISAFTASETRLYASNEQALFVYDIFDPEAPVLLNHDPSLTDLTSLALKTNHLFAAHNDTLFLIDVQNSEQLQVLGWIALGGERIRNLAVRGQKVFAQMRGSNSDGSLIIIDVTDPEHPQKIASHSLPGQDRALYVSENGATVFIGYHTLTVDGIQILDISDPQAIQLLATILTQGNPVDIQVNESTVYVAGNTEENYWYLESFDISDMGNISPGPSREGAGRISKIGIYDDMLICSIQGEMEALAKMDAPVSFQYRMNESPHLILSDAEAFSLKKAEKGSKSGQGMLHFLALNNLAENFRMRMEGASIFDLIVMFLVMNILMIIVAIGYFNLEGLQLSASLGLVLAGLTIGGSHVNHPKVQPVIHELIQNYPNPFNPETTIEYTIQKPCHVTLNVYDLRGRLVRTLVDEKKDIGSFTSQFDGIDLPTGIYTIQIQMGDQLESKKMLLVK